MGTLQEMLLAPENHAQVVADCEKLVEQEAGDMSGVTGAAVRLAYRTVRTFDAGHIPAMIESILPSVADALQPYWADFTAQFPGDASGSAAYGDFGDYLAKHEDEVAEALLSITDSRRRASSRMTIVKAYNTVRGSAIKHVKAALPATGALIQKYCLLAGGPASCGGRPPAPVSRRGTTPCTPVWGDSVPPSPPCGRTPHKPRRPPRGRAVKPCIALVAAHP